MRSCHRLRILRTNSDTCCHDYAEVRPVTKRDIEWIVFQVYQWIKLLMDFIEKIRGGKKRDSNL